MFCAPVAQNAKTQGIWNPLPSFATVRQDHQVRDIAPLRAFETAARTGKLPNVAWIIPPRP